MKQKAGLGLLFILIGFLVQGQNALILKERVGDKYFSRMSYVQAVATYEDVLKEDSTRISVLPKLGVAYIKIFDMKAAEYAYSRLVKEFPKDSSYKLTYAKILAINGNYKLSGEYYRMYAEANPGDSRGAAFAKAYADSPVLNIPNDNIVTIANFNSEASDFSPVFYRYGLVFCSARRSQSFIQRSFDWDLSSFLDLYLIEDTAQIKPAATIDTIQGKSKRRKLVYNDDDTRMTSNDTKTMAGYLSQKYIDTSGMFVTPPFEIAKFSKEINSKYHEGPVVFNRLQDKIIFTRNSYYNGRARKSSDGVTKLKLFTARLNELDKWVDIKSFPYNNNNYSLGHPALSLDDSILYFVSDMPGGIGGTDIYRCKMQPDGEWGKPENMGRPVNTEGNEAFPYIDKKGKFYFSSDGHPGFGSLDIFRTTLGTEVIENLGQPINSCYDDFGIALDKSCKEGFISSNRRRGFNDDDIYKVSIPKPPPYQVRIVDAKTNQQIDSASLVLTDTLRNEVKTEQGDTSLYLAALADYTRYGFSATAPGYLSKSFEAITDPATRLIEIRLSKLVPGCIVAGTITDKDSKAPIEGAEVVIFDETDQDTVYVFTTLADGKYKYAELKSKHKYLIEVNRLGYFNKVPVSLKTDDKECLSAEEREYDYLRDVILEKIVIGKAIKIENIYFDLGKYNIRPSAATELNKIVSLMNENPDIIIELSSHTDCRASFQYNMTLSDNRAKASAEYIIKHGISKERITGKGYGETKLVNDCGCEGKQVTRVCSEEEHQANRRTEFQVVGFLSDKNTRMLNNGKTESPASVPVPEQK